MNKIVSFLLFIGNAIYFPFGDPESLFAKDKIEFRGAIKVMAAIILCHLIFSPFVVPFIVLFFKVFFESPVMFLKCYYSFLGIMFLYSLWEVYSIKNEIIRTYFLEFSKMSPLRAIFLYVLIFGLGTLLLFMIISWGVPMMLYGLTR